MVSRLKHFMRRRESFWGFFLAGFLIYGLITLVRSETPHGRLVGRVVSQETGMPLPSAEIYLTRKNVTERFVSGKDGVFKIPSLPKGHYEVEAYTKAHSLEDGEFYLEEGETKEIVLSLKPFDPYLSLIHPQAVYKRGEKVQVGLQGFVKTDELQVRVQRVQIEANLESAPGEVIELLDDLRYGWWRGSEELERKRRKIGSNLKTVNESVVPITERGLEGIFLQYIPFPVSEPGIYLMEIGADELKRIALIVITDVGLVSKRTDDGSLLVWAVNLSSGAPASNVQVEAWSSARVQGQTNSLRLTSGRTGRDGMVSLSTRNASQSAQQIYVIAYLGSPRKPVAWLKFWNDEVSGGGSNSLVGHIYSDRPVYRPGHTVQYKGIVRLKSKQGYSLLPGNTPLEITVRDPNNNLVQRRETRLSATGSFDGSLQLNDEARTGVYSIEAKSGAHRLSGRFNVAAYRSPSIRVSLRPNRKFITPSDRVQISFAAQYYFGMPAGNAEVYYSVYRVPLYDWGPIDPEQEDYAEGDPEMYDHGEYLLRGMTTTREDGTVVISLSPKDLGQIENQDPYWTDPDYRVMVRAHVYAAGNEFAVGSTQFDLVQSDWKLQLQLQPPFGAPGNPINLKVGVNDRASGDPQQTTLRWRAGLVNWRGNRMEVDWLISNQSLQTGANGTGTAVFTPNRVGDWVIEAEAQDRHGNRTTVRKWVWISREGESYTRPASAPVLQIMTDKSTYLPGERAQVVMRSKKTDAWVWVTLEGDRLYETKIVQLRQGVGRVEFPISFESVPSAYVSACMVHDKQFTRQTLPLKIGAERKQLKIEIQSDKPRYEPRETAHIKLQVTDMDGRPVQAELSLAVVDEAIYAIREDQPTALYNAFYARRPNRVQTDYSFPWLALQGDKGEAERVRRYFPDTALWLPTLVTDMRGQASAYLTVPDTLTQWRITAHGHTANTKLGYAKAFFTCAKEFAVRLSVPPILVQGDTVTVSAIVSNNGTRNRRASIELIVAGTPVQSKSQFVKAGTTETVSWVYKADTVHPALPIQVRARSEDGKSDAEEKQVNVLPYATEKVVTRNLAFKAGEIEAHFLVPSNLLPAASRLQVRAAPSLISKITGSLDYLAGYPYGCTEQTMSRFLPSLMVLRTLREQNIPLPDLSREVPKMVEAGLNRLYRFQHYDGSWGWWENDPGDLWMTAYVMRGLSVAQTSGVMVNSEVYRSGRAALARLVRKSWKEGISNWDNYCFALYALASAGGELPFQTIAPSSPQDAAVRAPMIPPLNKLSSYSKALLYLALIKWDALHLQPDLLEKLRIEARSSSAGIYWTSTVQSPNEEWSQGWNNENETTAWVCLALMQAPQRDKRHIESAINWLLSRRQSEGWHSTKDTAIVLETMMYYARLTESPNLNRAGRLTVLLNGQPAGEIRFDNRSVVQPEAVLNIPLDAMRVGSNTLTFRLEGNLRVYSTIIFKQSIQIPEQTGEIIGGGHQLERRYSVIRSIRRTMNGTEVDERPLRSGDTVESGSLIRVQLRLQGLPDSVNHLILEDPVPSGCRPSEVKLPGKDETYVYGDDAYTTETRDDRMVAFYRTLQGDSMEYEYVMRAEVPGEYRILPPRLREMYGDFRVYGTGFRLRVR